MCFYKELCISVCDFYFLEARFFFIRLMLLKNKQEFMSWVERVVIYIYIYTYISLHNTAHMSVFLVIIDKYLCILFISLCVMGWVFQYLWWDKLFFFLGQFVDTLTKFLTKEGRRIQRIGGRVVRKNLL